ncbi:hypothetical protein J6590_028253 [Homalodisca vitripennis]|nr:hypothetical protein J6590_028253 [Homalodisca vitripennis]
MSRLNRETRTVLEKAVSYLEERCGTKANKVTVPELSHSYNLWHYWLEREWHTLAYELGNKQVDLSYSYRLPCQNCLTATTSGTTGWRGSGTPWLTNWAINSYNLWHYWLEREWHTLAYELGNKQVDLSYSYRLPCQNCLTATTSGTTGWRGSGTPWLTNWVTLPELSHSYNLWHYWLEREWHTLAYELGNKQLQVTVPELSHSYNLWHYWLEREWHTLAYELGNKQLQVTVPELSHSYNLWHYWLEREWHTLAYELGNKQLQVTLPELSHSYNLWHYWLEREWHTLAYELGNKQLQVTLPELSHSYNLWHYWLEREWHTLAYELGNKQLQVTVPELSHSYNLWHYWLEREWHTLAYELGNKQLQVTVPELSHSYNLWHYWLEREWHTLAYELGNKQVDLSYSYRLPCQNCLTATTSGTTGWRGVAHLAECNKQVDLSTVTVTLPELSHSYNLWHYWLRGSGTPWLTNWVTLPELSHSYNLWHYWLEREWHTLAYELGNKQLQVTVPELSHSYNLWHYWLEREWHTLAYELGNKQLQVTLPELSHSYNLWHYWLEREWHTLAYELGNKQLQVTVPELSHSYNLWHYWLEREWHTLAYELGNKQYTVSGVRELVKMVLGRSEFTVPTVLKLLESSLLPVTPKQWAEDKTAKLRQTLIEELGDDGVLVLPSFPTTAHQHYVPFFRPFNFCFWAIVNVLHFPATQVPLGLSRDGLPLGLQKIITRCQIWTEGWVVTRCQIWTEGWVVELAETHSHRAACALRDMNWSVVVQQRTPLLIIP